MKTWENFDCFDLSSPDKSGNIFGCHSMMVSINCQLDEIWKGSLNEVLSRLGWSMRMSVRVLSFLFFFLFPSLFSHYVALSVLESTM